MALRRVTITLGLLTVVPLAGRFLLLGADVPNWSAPTDLGLHLDDPARWIARRLLITGLHDLTPLHAGAALLCMVHGLATRAKGYMDDSYRVSLISIRSSGPLMLTTLWDPPPRYYAVVRAAASQLMIEHLGRDTARRRLGGVLGNYHRRAA